MIHATIALEGGVMFNLSNSRAVLLRLDPRQSPADNNPAKAFTISSVRTARTDEEPFLWDAHTLEELKARRRCDRETAQHRCACPNCSDPAFAGDIFIGMAITGTGVVMYRDFGLPRPRLDDTALNAPTQTALEDLVALCKTGISYGHSYHAPAGHDRAEPAVDQFVRKSSRSWKRVPVKGAVWDLMASYMAARPDTFKSGLGPRALWMLAHML